jgi:hypothetical protein
LTAFKDIAVDMLRLVHAGDMAGAKARAANLETAWDNAQALLQARNSERWTLVDNAIDVVLRNVRSGKTNAPESGASLEALIHVMGTHADQQPLPTSAPASAPVSVPASVQVSAPTPAPAARPLGDLSGFRKIADDMVQLVRADNVSRARSRAGELEAAWDKDESRLRPMSPERWTLADAAIDDVLKKVRAGHPSTVDVATSLDALIAVFDTLDGQK